jgi:hypothetical protein
MLGHFLEQQDMARQIGLERGAEQLAEHGDVEGGVRAAAIETRLERFGRAVGEPGQGPAHRGLAAVAHDVLRHRSVGQVGKAGAVEAGEQEAGVAIAEIDLVARRGRQRGDRRFGEAARAITAAGEPDGVERRIVGKFDEGRGPLGVGAGEMIVDEEALRVEDDLEPRMRLGGDRPYAIGGFLAEARARRHHADPRARRHHSDPRRQDLPPSAV